jgi:hypothetical protein
LLGDVSGKLFSSYTVMMMGDVIPILREVVISGAKELRKILWRKMDD